MKNHIIILCIITLLSFTNVPRAFEDVSNQHNDDYDIINQQSLNKIKTYHYFNNLMRDKYLVNTALSGTEKQDFIDTLYNQVNETNIIHFSWCLSAAYTETRFNNKAVGKSGELGMFQFMSFTAKEVCKKMGIEYYYGIERDIKVSVKMWYFHMNELLEYYDNDIELAFYAYNAGKGRINQLYCNIDLIKREIYYKNNYSPYFDKIRAYNNKITQE